MKKRKEKKFVLLHAHGQAGPNSRRSYLKFGTYSSRKNAVKGSKEYGLNGYRVVPKSKISPSKLKGAKGLYYVKK